jgi:hypothetical protein
MKLATAVLAITLLASGCSDSEEDCSNAPVGECGIVKNQVTVVFKQGTTRAQVDAINAEIGATVVLAPDLTTAYRIQLPRGWCYQRGVAFYESKPEVAAASAAINICPDT